MTMKKTSIELLKNPAVIDEIERHKWLESEKAGQDIGMEKATRDWLVLHSIPWCKAHQPKD
ncbi:MAG: hypothetical protein HQL21_03610 [Candidatus Omnitrophica bacterium]|nr:hypothetical protein [Candidatus Omnitrophota bacterium]